MTLVGHSYGGRVDLGVSHIRWPTASNDWCSSTPTPPTAPDSGQTPERDRGGRFDGGHAAVHRVRPRPERGGWAPTGADWFLERVRPQSFATFMAPMPETLPEGVRRTFVFATGYAPTRFDGYARGARDDPSWEYVELDGSHWLMFSHPDDVARIILDG